MVCMFGGIVFYDPFHGYNALESAAYGALHRTIWALGSFGIMYSVSFGTFIFLYKCLSWRPWVPLSKLVFGAYLWHFLFQLRTLGKANSTQVFNFFDVVNFFIKVYGCLFILPFSHFVDFIWIWRHMLSVYVSSWALSGSGSTF